MIIVLELMHHSRGGRGAWSGAVGTNGAIAAKAAAALFGRRPSCSVDAPLLTQLLLRNSALVLRICCFHVFLEAVL